MLWNSVFSCDEALKPLECNGNIKGAISSANYPKKSVMQVYLQKCSTSISAFFLLGVLTSSLLPQGIVLLSFYVPNCVFFVFFLWV